ncbi:AglZ/HisF2 family acetamidino modification protein [Bdellovibrio bacteriovorus]|uniref:imidazole glycerol-phosphate synthase n=1 Tax=Bdellovibrio bacteriovorus str. Tiberius TaxID=1069642 RepID=K7Z9W7_BDEBC|nr:AglZ/HisF2 family acetamidino modification protein [Bdellovibrio bacteriovorus]AFY01369.1 imidazole glycerol phosphate synthase subunit HisF [Bdellovibrio bacteriovorus str. Tiberius]
MRTRIIPTLLLKGHGFYKSQKFKDLRYLGDPINILKIFNEKEVDEVLILDISVSKEGQEPQYDLLRDLAGEAFMPLGYGGGIKDISQIKKILNMGFEKVCLNSSVLQNPMFVKEAAKVFGSSTISVMVDVKKNFFGKYEVFNHVTSKSSSDPLKWAKELEGLGVGEIILNSVDRDGVMKGFDLELIKTVSSQVSVPVVASGGAGSVQDLHTAISGGASAVAAGSLFVFQGPLRAVLVSYPSDEECARVGFNR